MSYFAVNGGLSTTFTTAVMAMFLLSSDDACSIKFCPVTSPTGEIAYVTSSPSRVATSQTLTQCATHCAFSSQLSGGINQCRCFNYNTTSFNCSLFYNEPTVTDFDDTSDVSAYQIIDNPLTGLWSTVNSSSCAFPFYVNGTIHTRCRHIVVGRQDRQCDADFYMCYLKDSLVPAFCNADSNNVSTVKEMANRPYSKAEDCSYPFTNNGVMYYTCARNVSGITTPNSPLACSLRNRTFVNCYPPADFQAVTAARILTVSTLPPVMTLSVAGWIVMQQRIATPVGAASQFNWQRGWAEYKSGFGTAGSNFWLGLEVIHQLTSAASYRLRVEVQQAFTGLWYSAEYWYFVIGDETTSQYQLNVDGYYGDSGDSLRHISPWYHNRQKFSTIDAKNNGNCTIDCPVNRGGAWWYDCCFWACLTCKDEFAEWDTLSLSDLSYQKLTASRMMIRLND